MAGWRILGSVQSVDFEDRRCFWDVVRKTRENLQVVKMIIFDDVDAIWRQNPLGLTLGHIA